MRKAIVAFVLMLCVVSFSRGVLVFPNADIYYPKKHRDTAIYVGRMFEEIRQEAIDYIGYDPGRINIVLVDYGTSTNGLAQSAQHNTIKLFVWPPDGYSGTRLNASSWYRQVLVHEFTHIVHTKYSTGLAAVFAWIFGDVPTSQMFSPFIEAVTIFAESQMHESEGRINNPIWGPGLYTSNYLSGSFPTLSQNMAPFSYSPRDYRGGALYYNYMAGFYDYLVSTYGIDSVKEYHRVISHALPVVGLIMAPRRAFGKSLPLLYAEWKNHISERAQEIASLPEAHIARNGLIYDIHVHEDRIFFSGATLGAVSSWAGFADPFFTELLDDGTTAPIARLGSSMVKQDYGYIYALRDAVSERNVTSNFATVWTREIWKISRGERDQVVARGPITAFDIHEEVLYVAFYDTVTRTSMIIAGSNVLAELDWQIKDLAISADGRIALYLSKEGYYGAIGLLEDGQVQFLVKDSLFKGSGISWWENKIVFTAAYETGSNDAFAVDVDDERIYRLTEGAILAEAVVKNDTVYGIGHSTTQRGMSIFEIPVSVSEYPRAMTTEDVIPQADVDYSEANYSGKSLAYFIRPSIVIPYFSIEEPNTTIGLLTMHNSVFDDHYMEVTPTFTFGENLPGLDIYYSYSPIPRLNISVGGGFSPLTGFNASLALTGSIYETSFSPHGTLQVFGGARINSDLMLRISSQLQLSGVRWSLRFAPSFDWRLDEFDLVPEMRLSIGATFAPALSTLVRLSGDISDVTRLSAGVVQNLLEINRGIYPFLFLGEVAVGAEARMTNLSFGGLDLYATLGISETLVRLITLYPKIGISFSEDFSPGFLFRLDTQM